MIYNTIIHDVRKRLGLNNDEYCVLDTIGQLSNKPHHTRCTKSKVNIAEDIGIPERTVYRIINRLQEWFYIEKSASGLRALEVWYDAITDTAKMAVGGNETLPNCQNDTAKMAVKNNNKNLLSKDNNIYRENQDSKNNSGAEKNLSPLPPSLTLGEREQEFIEKYGKEMIDNFLLYWNELTPNKKKRRYQKQDFFDISGRLVTRHRNSLSYSKSNNESKGKNNVYQRHVSNRLQGSHDKDYTAGAEELGIKVVQYGGG